MIFFITHITKSRRFANWNIWKKIFKNQNRTICTRQIRFVLRHKIGPYIILYLFSFSHHKNIYHFRILWQIGYKSIRKNATEVMTLSISRNIWFYGLMNWSCLLLRLAVSFYFPCVFIFCCYVLGPFIKDVINFLRFLTPLYPLPLLSSLLLNKLIQ